MEPIDGDCVHVCVSARVTHVRPLISSPTPP